MKLAVSPGRGINRRFAAYTLRLNQLIERLREIPPTSIQACTAIQRRIVAVTLRRNYGR
jgi:hypothetical protein